MPNGGLRNKMAKLCWRCWGKNGTKDCSQRGLGFGSVLVMASLRADTAEGRFWAPAPPDLCGSRKGN